MRIGPSMRRTVTLPYWFSISSGVDRGTVILSSTS